MPQHRLYLIVGLGNPGEKYRGTRHNVGFLVVEGLAKRHGISLDTERFEARFGTGRIGPCRAVLAEPVTFMNRSGSAVSALVRYFGMGVENILVIHDDIDLVFGKIKIKKKGGDGGHNGVRSLMEACGTDEFVRVRIGVGRPDGWQGVSDYVLDKFDVQQEATLGEVISTAQDTVETILFEGVPEAMNRFHGRTIPEG